MLGFAPFNRPVAKVFLGDVGSLPIGLLLGWCLLQLAYSQQFAAALLLPLYYLADATVTLLRRLIRREPFWAAHRSHFYQRATDNGFSVLRVVSEVFALNVGLAVLAIASTRTRSAGIDVMLTIVGGLGVALTMYRFSRRRPTTSCQSAVRLVARRNPSSRLSGGCQPAHRVKRLGHPASRCSPPIIAGVSGHR